MYKTSAAVYSALEKELVEAHPYELPEIIAFPIERGLSSYLSWIDEMTKPNS